MQSARRSLACFQTRSGRRIPEKTAEKPAERKTKQKNPVAAEIAATHVMIVIAVTAVIPVMTDVILAETAPAVPAVRSREDKNRYFRPKKNPAGCDAQQGYFFRSRL